MSLLVITVLLSVLMSSYPVHGYRHSSGLESNELDTESFRQLIRQLQLEDDDQQLFVQSRAQAEGDCTGQILDGYQWSGPTVMSMGGIDTVQRCMDNCDIDVKCMGWSYKADSRMCWGMTAIEGVLQVSGVKSGSCIGTNIKAKCTESKVGYYNGQYTQVSQSVESAKACMAACDQSSTCFGWYYAAGDKKCFLGSFIRTYVSSYNWLSTGSCLAPQKRVRVADPLKIFRQESLDRHNDKRKRHCAPALNIDDGLNKAAQQVADRLATADITPPDYDISTMQTVYFNKGNAAVRGSVIVDNFYDERKYYNYDDPDFGFTSHFPKVIWKSSTKMGVGRAFTRDNGTMFIVTKYDWTGDITETYTDNVQDVCA